MKKSNARNPGKFLFLLVFTSIFALLLHSPAATAEVRTINVGIYENAPKVFTTESGRPAGIFIDILEEIAKAEGWQLHYIRGNWQQGLDRLEKGGIDLMPDVAYTAEREQIFAFHKTPVLSGWSQVYARKRSGIQSILDLSGKRVAVLEQTIQLETMKVLAHGFELNITLVPVADYKTEFQMVADGKVDAGVTNRFYGLMNARSFGLEETPIVFDPAPFFFAAPKNAPHQLQDTIDYHLNRLKTDPHSVYYISLKRWTSEEVHFKVPAWVQITGLILGVALLVSLGASAVLKHKVTARTRELDRINNTLRENEQKYRHLFENNPVPMFIYQRGTYRMLAVNDAFVHHYGYSREEALSLLLTDLYPENEKERIKTVAATLKGRAYVGEWHHRKADGSVITVIARSHDMDYWGGNARIAVITDITEMKRMQAEQKLIEQALRESELKHRTLFETANDGIVLMQRGKVIDCNARALEIFGCNRDGIIGAPSYEYLPLPESNGGNSAEIAPSLSDGPQCIEWEHCRQDGSRFIAEVSLNRLELGEEMLLQAIVRDITERKMAEIELRDSSERFQAIFDMLPWGVCITDPEDGTFLHVNPSFGGILGFSYEEMIGHTSRGLNIWRNDDERNVMVGGLRKTGEFKGEVILRRKDGLLITANLCSKLIPLDGAKRILVVLEDITERKRAAEAIRELNANLERRVAERTSELAVARDRAEAADRLKSAFLATMSHELRTPLNSIIGFTGIILLELAGPLNEEQRKQLEMVRTSAKHLLALINDVLDISKIEAGQLEVSSETFDLTASIMKVIDIVKPLADKKTLNLGVEIAPEVGTLTSDARRVEQVLMNLLNNAVKFTEQGMVRVAAWLAPDCPESTQSEIRISVTDTGMGIKPEDLAKIFQPFRQVDSGLSRRHEGTGLGLAICRRLADLLGGKISVESKWSEGSVFTLSLPIREEEKS